VKVSSTEIDRRLCEVGALFTRRAVCGL